MFRLTRRITDIKILRLYIPPSKGPQPVMRIRISDKPFIYHCHRCHKDTLVNRKYKGAKYYTLPRYCGKCDNPDHDTFPEIAYSDDFHPFTTLNPISKRSIFQDADDVWCVECFTEWVTEWAEDQNGTFTNDQIIWMFDNRDLLPLSDGQVSR